MRRNPHNTNTDDHKFAQELRRLSSPYERKLWFVLRQNAALVKLKFRRQQPIHPYVADFACMAAKLLVELDGVSHDVRADYDLRRDAYLRDRGYVILRFRNEELKDNLEGIVKTILAVAVERSGGRHPLTSKN